jgi:subtilisin family serine protease
MRKFAVLAPVMLAVAACQDSTSPSPTAIAPSRVTAAQNAAPNDYIVTFRDDESDPEGQANGLVKAHGGSLKHVYRYALKGFAVADLPDAAVEALQRNPRIARIERDGIVTIDGTQTPAPSWGLDRIDAAAGTDGSYNYPNDGSGVTAYIIDTGIYSGHSDFTGRIGTGADFVDANPPDDCNGHGTHVAGTVGGTKYGVAKNVTIIAVRVLNCQGSGTTSGVIAGIDWVAGRSARPAVANMSLGGGFSQSLNDAVARATGAGVVFAIAAGNSADDACLYSPASAPSAITVGATTLSNALASYSNFGKCVDILAPGSSITSDWIGSTTATNTISGTSMATPHVTGASALYLSANPNASASDVAAALGANATANAISGVPAETPNKLLYVGFIGASVIGGGGGGGGGSAPVVGLTKSCSGFTCTFRNTSTGATKPPVWEFTGAAPSTIDPIENTVTYGKRQSGSVKLTVSNDFGSASATQTVSCNPVKCQ